MVDNLESITRQVQGRRDFDSPPLHLWNPELSGDIPIRIARDGSWFHDGDPIRRDSLRNLFASILRREDDGEYYLVTPSEKWRIEVDLHPLIVTDAEIAGGNLQLTLNTGKVITAGEEYQLFLDPSVDNVAAVTLWHGLTALFSRSAWYRLAAYADEDGLVAGDTFSFQLT